MSLAEFARIPFIDEIVDAERLSQRLGFAVAPTRIRVKPGHGALLAWRRDPRSGASSSCTFTSADWGWTAIVTDPNKLDNIRRRAERRGTPIRLHAAGEARSVLVSGELPGDPKLNKVIGRPGSGFSSEAEVLGYNPGRRLLLRSGNRFVRISSTDCDHLVRTSRQWQRWGIPTLPVEFLGRRRTSVHSPWWGTGDLERCPDAGIATAVGESIAELHRQEPPTALGTVVQPDELSADDAVSRPDVPPPPGLLAGQVPGAGPDIGPPPASSLQQDSSHPDTPGSSCSPLDLVDVARTLAELVPELDADLRTLADELGTRLAQAVEEGEDRPLHGDLSPDQVLIDGDDFRIIDLDRAGAGPAGVDVGSWVARCRMNDLTDMEDAFLDGYARRGGRIDDVEAWCARALLTTAIEPFRQCRTDWRDQTVRTVAAAKQALR